MVVGQKVALGRAHAGRTVTIDVTDTDLTIHGDDGARTVRRTNELPIRNLKANRPRKVDSDSGPSKGAEHARPVHVPDDDAT